MVARQLACDPAIEVAANAPDGEAALSVLRRRAIDVVVLDVEMPIMDGLTALPLILAASKGVKVVMASTLTLRNADVTLRALQLGASDFVAKPDATPGALEAFGRELRDKVKALGGSARSSAPSIQPPPLRALARSAAIRPEVIAIGASTGGPPALLALFEAIRGRIQQPILITQHMPPTFTALFAERLAEAGERPCREGQDGEPVLAGQAYVAPGGWHMTVEAGPSCPRLQLNQEAPEHYCRPAGDPMLRSLSRLYGSGVLAVILTGMGSDGADGCAAVSRMGGRIVVQDEATSVVWGMPGAAAHTGLAEKILPLPQIGPWIAFDADKLR